MDAGGVGQPDRSGNTFLKSVSHGGDQYVVGASRAGGAGGQGKENKGRRINRGRKGFGYGVSQGAGPGNTNVRELLPDRRYTGAILDFLGTTRVGEVKSGVIKIQ